MTAARAPKSTVRVGTTMSVEVRSVDRVRSVSVRGAAAAWCATAFAGEADEPSRHGLSADGGWFSAGQRPAVECGGEGCPDGDGEQVEDGTPVRVPVSSR
jgi:hypothetical protein